MFSVMTQQRWVDMMVWVFEFVYGAQTSCQHPQHPYFLRYFFACVCVCACSCIESFAVDEPELLRSRLMVETSVQAQNSHSHQQPKT